MSDVFGEQKDEKVLAVDMSAKAAIETIEEIESPAELAEFMEGEGRKTVLAAAQEKFPSANAEADPAAELMEIDPDEMPDPVVDVEIDTTGSVETKKKGRSSVDPPQAPGKEKMYLIEIDSVEGRPNFQFVSVNGKAYRIKRGEPVAVPESVLGVLNDATAERFVQEHQPGGQVKTTRHKYSAVPFRVLRAL